MQQFSNYLTIKTLMQLLCFLNNKW
jgi:hypothetical protein